MWIGQLDQASWNQMASVSLLPSMYSTRTLAVFSNNFGFHTLNLTRVTVPGTEMCQCVKILCNSFFVGFCPHWLSSSDVMVSRCPQSHGKVCVFFFHGMPHYQRGWEEGKILHKHKHTNKLQKWLEYWTPQEIGWLWDSSPYLETGQRQQHPVNLTTPTWDDIPWGSPWQNPHELYIDSI